MKNKNLLLCILIGVLIIGIFPLISAENSESPTEWWMFQKNLAHTGWDGNNFSTIAGLNNANFTTGGAVSSSPAVANGYVYVGSDDGYLYQLNASNVSQEIASYYLEGDIPNPLSIIVANNLVYATTNGGNIFQFNALNISQLVGYGNSLIGEYSTLSVTNEYLYVGSDAFIYQFNVSDVSQIINKYDMGSSIDWKGSVPTIANGYVYIANDIDIFQFNANNVSELITQSSLGDMFYSSPAVYNDYIYIGGESGAFYQLNASDVSQVISSYSASDIFYVSPVIVGEYIYVGNNDGNFQQLNASDVSQVISTYSIVGGGGSSPVYANGYIYVGEGNGTMGNLLQLNASNVSQLIASYPYLEGSSSPAYANGYIYVGSLDGYVYQLNASNISLENNFPAGTEPVSVYVYLTSGYSYKTYDADISDVATGSVDGMKGATKFFPTFIVLGSLVVLIILTILIINSIRASGITQEGA